MIYTFHKSLRIPEILQFAKKYNFNYYFPRLEQQKVFFSDSEKDIPKFLLSVPINGINYTFKVLHPKIYEK